MKPIKLSKSGSAKYRYPIVPRSEKRVGCRILIVCEGVKTEPNYFREFHKKQVGSMVYDLEIDGAGTDTKRVVEKAINLRGSQQIPFDRVWAVFDRDSFKKSDFNDAIFLAERNGIEVAWSNEAFELWFLLHFHNQITAMPRSEYKRAITGAVKAKLPKGKGRSGYQYEKNATDNYRVMNTYGDQAQAIRWAEEQHSAFVTTNYADFNPCTTVYRLIRQLIGEDQDLVVEVMKKISGN